MPETSRPDCYACQHRVGVPGDTHSECRHPAATIVRGMAFMAAAMSAPDEAEAVGIETVEGPGGAAIEISFQAHGVRSGWATWPLNFDPAWLRACSGFERKKVTPEQADA